MKYQLMTSLAALLSAVQAEEGATEKRHAPTFVRAAKSPSKSGKASPAPTYSPTKSSKSSKAYSYCTWSPDYSCYDSGWPACCADDGGANCPRERPGCDRYGASYCVWGPDYSCYATGWPTCCARNDGRDCPSVQPGCDMAGASYCTWAPDNSCYESGWPQCCAENDGRDCPPGQPVCDKAGASYCVWAPNYSCYAYGWPACCAQNEGRDCPDEQPGCDMSIDDCVELGNTAAELVVITNWCQPGDGGSSPFRTPEYLPQCKEVATSICEGQIYNVAQDWCPGISMSTTTLLTLQGGCQAQVDSMVPGLELALK